MLTGSGKKRKFKTKYLFLCIFLIVANLCSITINADEEEDYLAEVEKRKSLAIQSDVIENWPAGPKLGCESAVLMEVNTGTVLYAKNVDEQLYPASVTKLLTALIAMEKCDMDEMVTFSQAAIDSIDWRNDANLGISPGDSITMEQCLYGLLVGSANEVAYAIAEHISGEGNIAGFAELMNEKARELGCTGSNFVTPNGIHDSNHYTTAHDLALIGQAFFSNELLSRMACTTSYKVPKTSTQPRDDMIVYAKSKLHQGKEYAYDGLVGTKTGFTNYARQTLVSCAEKNGMRLVCVIMKEESPYQFTDTVDLFNYGFDNFQAVNVSENDKTYVIQSLKFFSTSSDFFGSSKPILQMNSTDYIVIPIDADFENTTSELSYDNLNENEIARVNYYYNDAYVGSASIEPAVEVATSFDFGPRDRTKVTQLEEEEVIIINVKSIIIKVISVALLIIVLFTLKDIILSKHGIKRKKTVTTPAPTKKVYKTSNTKDLNWKGFD